MRLFARLSLLRMRAGARRFGRADGGVSAVEFAILAPVMLTMWLGTVEVGQLIGIHWKTKLVTRTLADLTSRSITVTNTEMNNIFAATLAVIAPYNPARLSMRVTSIKRNASNQDRVVWSSAPAGSGLPARPTNEIVALPAGTLTKSGESVIFAEAVYRYETFTQWVVNKDIINLPSGETSFPIDYDYLMIPRQVPEVLRTP